MSTISYTADLKEPRVRKKTMTMMMSLIIFVVVMMFAAWSSAYIVSMSSGFWAQFDLPSAFLVSTCLIMLCSVGMIMALRAAKKGDQKMMVGSLIITLVLSLGFGASQFSGWSKMIASGNYVQSSLLDIQGVYGEDHFFYYKGTQLLEIDGQYYMPADSGREFPLNDELDSARNTASSYFYVLTFMHLLHVLIGVGLVIYLLFKAMKGRYGQQSYLGVKLSGMYWHFMGGLWIYIMVFLHIIH